MRDALPKFFKRFQITSAVFLTKREVDNGYDLIKMQTFLRTWGEGEGKLRIRYLRILARCTRELFLTIVSSVDAFRIDESLVLFNGRYYFINNLLHCNYQIMAF